MTAPIPRRKTTPELLGGRMWLALSLLAAIAIISNNWVNYGVNWLVNPSKAPVHSPWAVGDEAFLKLTLITADQDRLNCAHNAIIEGTHCDFSEGRRRWARRRKDPVDNNRENVIQPYRTADTNQLVLVAGLWAQPELAYRVHQEPKRLYPVKKQLRFVAYCQVKFIGKLEKAALRWDSAPRTKWQENQTAFVAQPIHCTLTDPDAEQS